jgi:rhodanese-related sulfurtransferase/biotin operon repressor
MPRRFKTELFDQFARIGKALASGRRLELLEHLAQGSRSVEALAKVTGLSVANASQHLQVLRAAGLATSERDGLHVRYRLADPAVLALWRSLRDVGQLQLAEVERLVALEAGQRRDMEPMSLETLKRKLAAGTVILLDVRPADEYAAGHIPGARNVSLAELAAHFERFPRAVDIVAYCRGPYCFLSDEAVEILRTRGRRGIRLEQGFPDWAAQGWPIETIEA